MRVAALSLAGINTASIDQYRADLADLLNSAGAYLAVLPAYNALVLGLGTGLLETGANFESTCKRYISDSAGWNGRFLELHSSLARETGIFLAAGTVFEEESGCRYHTAYCFNPDGEVCCKQRQTHLSKTERALGLSRGKELDMFSVGELQAGLVVGNDARHPEVGRIFALRGTGIILHCGALDSALYCWPQAAGMWAQVQQNQFWTVEAQLVGHIAGSSFGASSAVIGPCEITPGLSGYLARGYPHSPVVSADLNEHDLRRIRYNYPLLKLLNREAYRDLLAGY